jgi:hypothetical protein
MKVAILILNFTPKEIALYIGVPFNQLAMLQCKGDINILSETIYSDK